MTLSIPLSNEYGFKFGYDWIVKESRIENGNLVLTILDGEQNTQEITLNLTEMYEQDYANI